MIGRMLRDALTFPLVSWSITYSAHERFSILSANLSSPQTDSVTMACCFQVIESILDDDNDMQDMYLGRRAAVEAMAKQQVRDFQA